ncbi:hypothetical protein THAOC_30657 [Thalassiosira oceanica]|uniref:Glycosyl transferase family 1 domain-containing protein n=1 Tax=Thalassiosira oceanica TaxID=159749 RepID=K0RDN4_THAOC|nr:hypothetical protein THAOC_30657 [Thalassiosira oceanica]|eukprot:EJK50384.1 hypothetical protein THAOC_30657 [Thalassiosira oceanica]
MDPISYQPNDHAFCKPNGPGSLHRQAIMAFNYSSPVSSASYKKLQHVLNLNDKFHLNMAGGQGIFDGNRQCISRMLTGYGLGEAGVMTKNDPGVTLVETKFTNSSCPLDDEKCVDQGRIFLQTEQIIRWAPMKICHASPNCVIADFSQYNLYLERRKEVGDSVVLLPIMTQTPSRLKKYEPDFIKPLKHRPIDIIFYGTPTNRRKILSEEEEYYKKHGYPERNITFITNREAITTNKVALMGEAYEDAKVCVVVHAHDYETGGEYHRYSEFGPFGCVPVVEFISDYISVEALERCGGFNFVSAQVVFQRAIEIVGLIDRDMYQDEQVKAMTQWWKDGIQWESLLSDLGLRMSGTSQNVLKG